MLETILPYLVSLILGVLYYREVKRAKMAEAVLTEVTAAKVKTEDESIAVESLGKALTFLQNSFDRISARSKIMEISIAELQREQIAMHRDNKALQERMFQLREVIVQLLAGVTKLSDQLSRVAPGIAPEFTVDDLEPLLAKEDLGT